MKCPICKIPAQEEQALEAGLSVIGCAQCAGVWIPGRRYWAWIHDGGAEMTAAVHEAPAAARDSLSAKICPECGRFLHRYDVGHGCDFGVDKCNACGGFWLDANEWQTLACAGLQGKLHLITTDDWQREVERAQHVAARKKLLAARLGEAEFAELDRVKAWTAAHPHKAEVVAYLLDEEGAG